MKVAIFHDYLNQFGGAERVLQVFLEMFPDADLYTLLYDREKTLGLFDGRISGTSVLDIKPVRNRHRLFIPFMPLASRTVPVNDGYDLIISSSAGYAKGFGSSHQDVNRFHLCYCHSPLRYAWEVEYLQKLPFSPWVLAQVIFRPILSYLRKWDKRASNRVNAFVTNSEFIADKVEAYYGRDARVVYPPVDMEKFYTDSDESEDGYYLMAGRLLYYKLFDIGIRAFNQLHKPLKVVGAGPEAQKLKRIAGPTVEFVSGISDDELRRVYSNAKAFIFPQTEDFGLVAAEAQACGTPVIAHDSGGAKEIVENEKTGLLFENQRVEDVVDAVRRFEDMSLDRDYIAERARRFSKDLFVANMREVLKESGFEV